MNARLYALTAGKRKPDLFEPCVVSESYNGAVVTKPAGTARPGPKEGSEMVIVELTPQQVVEALVDCALTHHPHAIRRHVTSIAFLVRDGDTLKTLSPEQLVIQVRDEASYI